MSENIKSLIKAEIEAKHGFQAAQESVRVEINNTCKIGACETIETDEVIGGNKIAIRIEKKGEGPQYCSWTKVKIKPSVAQNPEKV